jgi:CRISPR-associated endonuclease/helicase Cas3
MRMTYWAHSDRGGLSMDAAGSKWQPLAEHLEHVAGLSRRLAEEAAPNYNHFHQLAEWSGLLHDYGKYTECFQQMIATGRGKCPHAIYGAAMAYWGLKAPHVASAIAGHHAGMPDLGDLRDKVRAAHAEALAIHDRASKDTPAVGRVLAPPPPVLEDPGIRFDLLSRMLLSCLVDADRLDTSERSPQRAPLKADERLKMLLAHMDELSAKPSGSVMKEVRREVLEDCLLAAAFPERILSLSVPTGGGKTLAAMAYALRRSALEPRQFRRVIVVIPYLSIIEQNAEVYSNIFGASSILEHHSGSYVRLRERDKDHFEIPSETDEKYQRPGERPETENWDAPLIVTTSVRFFESLFSNHPSDLRRVHNIARSIVILDEVQVLPRPLLGPLLDMMSELTRDWGCSFVLSTATKPAFERRSPAGGGDLRWDAGTVREIVRRPVELHRRLCRVRIDWRIEEPVEWGDVAGWMLEQEQALCVVNLRDHAATLYDEVRTSRASAEGLFHLSTRMCPAHRLQRIEEIQARLESGSPCLVVSTQLIEAGVDLDFPVAFRALGPLDSIVQVAGRADREGRLTASLGRPGGRLVVFKPTDHRLPPNEYAHATGITETLAKTRSIQPDDLDTMSDFFESYYGGADLGSNLMTLRRDAKFKQLATKFEMISSRMQDVYVPFGEGRELINKLMEIRHLTGELRRALQRYSVGLQPWEFQKARESGLYRLEEDSDIWIAGDSSYSTEIGLEVQSAPDGTFI